MINKLIKGVSVDETIVVSGEERIVSVATGDSVILTSILGSNDLEKGVIDALRSNRGGDSFKITKTGKELKEKLSSLSSRLLSAIATHKAQIDLMEDEIKREHGVDPDEVISKDCYVYRGMGDVLNLGDMKTYSYKNMYGDGESVGQIGAVKSSGDVEAQSSMSRVNSMVRDYISLNAELKYVESLISMLNDDDKYSIDADTLIQFGF